MPTITDEAIRLRRKKWSCAKIAELLRTTPNSIRVLLWKARRRGVALPRPVTVYKTRAPLVLARREAGDTLAETADALGLTINQVWQTLAWAGAVKRRGKSAARGRAKGFREEPGPALWDSADEQTRGTYADHADRLLAALAATTQNGQGGVKASHAHGQQKSSRPFARVGGPD